MFKFLKNMFYFLFIFLSSCSIKMDEQDWFGFMAVFIFFVCFVVGCKPSKDDHHFPF